MLQLGFQLLKLRAFKDIILELKLRRTLLILIKLHILTKHTVLLLRQQPMISEYFLQHHLLNTQYFFHHLIKRWLDHKLILID